jgi:trimethylamine corrinoid protein
MSDVLIAEAMQAVKKGEEDKAAEVSRRALAEGMDPLVLIEQGLVPAIQEMGDLFSAELIFLPELLLAANAAKSATAICTEALPKERIKSKGKIVLGTVEGDIHDIGKSIVASFLSANGFEVFDLGRDVAMGRFIEKAVEVGADVIASSALLTTTMSRQRDLEEKLLEAGLKGRFKTMVGGAPVDLKWADKIAADAYAENAAEAVKKLETLIGDRTKDI